jgi:hypothetical protein
MGPEALPTFRLQTNSEGRLIGRFEPSPWAQENAIAVLYLGGGRFLWGRFCRVDHVGATCELKPDDPTEPLALRTGESSTASADGPSSGDGARTMQEQPVSPEPAAVVVDHRIKAHREVCMGGQVIEQLSRAGLTLVEVREI